MHKQGTKRKLQEIRPKGEDPFRRDNGVLRSWMAEILYEAMESLPSELILLILRYYCVFKEGPQRGPYERCIFEGLPNSGHHWIGVLYADGSCNSARFCGEFCVDPSSSPVATPTQGLACYPAGSTCTLNSRLRFTNYPSVPARGSFETSLYPTPFAWGVVGFKPYTQEDCTAALHWSGECKGRMIEENKTSECALRSGLLHGPARLRESERDAIRTYELGRLRLDGVEHIYDLANSLQMPTWDGASAFIVGALRHGYELPTHGTLILYNVDTKGGLHAMYFHGVVLPGNWYVTLCLAVGMWGQLEKGDLKEDSGVTDLESGERYALAPYLLGDGSNAWLESKKAEWMKSPHKCTVCKTERESVRRLFQRFLEWARTHAPKKESFIDEYQSFVQL